MSHFSRGNISVFGMLRALLFDLEPVLKAFDVINTETGESRDLLSGVKVVVADETFALVLL